LNFVKKNLVRIAGCCIWLCRVVVATSLALFAVAAVATPEKASSLYESALKHFENGDDASAIVQLKNSIQQDQKMLAAHLLLGKALLRSGQLKAAEAALEEALKQGVNRGEIAMPLGQTYLALGIPSQVIERIPAAGLPASLQVEVLAMRGVAYAESGNSRLATQAFAEARALDPNAASPLIAEVPVLLGQGQLEQARALATKAIQLAPDNANAWNVYASTLHAALDWKGALAAYDKTLSLRPRFADPRVARAALLIDINREADAVKDLDFLKTVVINEPRAAYLRALIAAKAGNGPAVAAALGEVVKVTDALPPAWVAGREQLLMAAGLANHALGNWEKAREYLEIAIGRNSRNMAARKLLASVFVETRDYPRAQPLLESLLGAMPDDPQVLYLLGTVYMSQRRFAQATDLLERAAARTGLPEMNRSLGFSQLGLGKADQGQASLEKALASKPGDFQTSTALATLYMRQGSVKKAIQTAEAAARIDPENLTALNFLASLRDATGDRAGARADYTAILGKSASFRSAILNLAKLDVRDSRFDDARRRLNEMLARKNDDSDALFELGLLEQRAGRPVEAMRHMKKAAEIQRRDPRAGLALVDIYMAQRSMDEAMNTAKELASKFPDSLLVQITLGRAYLALGDARSARSVFQTATKMAEYDAAIQVNIGRLQLASGNPDGAFYNAQKALQGRPDDPAALMLVVEVEGRRGDTAKADAALKLLSAKYPNRVEAALAGGNLAMARGQYAVAVAAYKTALSREENTGNALNLATALVAAGEAAKAAAFLEGWVKNRGNDLPAMKALAEAQHRAGQFVVARASYARLIAVQPDDVRILNNYANLLLKLKDPGAQMQAERALKLDPSNPALSDTLGWIMVQYGQVESGLRFLREARLREPDNGEIRFHLAYALSKVGRKAEARDELAAAGKALGQVESREELAGLRKELGL
jgi:putative PEP-CTERM system TPR-repeat lipoprotein